MTKHWRQVGKEYGADTVETTLVQTSYDIYIYALTNMYMGHCIGKKSPGSVPTS
jgi:hypothetical protein